MSANSIGEHLRLTTCGESHGEALAGILDGVPAGIELDLEVVKREMARRRPGQSAISTPRKEKDDVRIISGVFEGRTTGTPIGMIIENEDHHSADYGEIARKFRPSHADFTYTSKYGLRDYRGGGRSSARETAVRVAAGAIARQILPCGVDIKAYVSSVGGISLDADYTRYDLSQVEENDVRCPDAVKAAAMKALIEECRAAGDSVGGVVTCVVKGVPVGLGEPIFDRLEARLAAAMMSIPASKGFEVGSGFAGSVMRGSEHNDIFVEGGRTATNRSGGIQGGISNGMDIYFRVAFKAVATIMKEQETIDVDGRKTTLKARGRHDPCVVPRAVPVVEAMTALTLADFYLMNRMTRIK
ncbi:MAG: chorismate synthase [Flavobacteriales bacterium]|nr:chorismate synthase [Flavobacteriales bacterium]